MTEHIYVRLANLEVDLCRCMHVCAKMYFSVDDQRGFFFFFFLFNPFRLKNKKKNRADLSDISAEKVAMLTTLRCQSLLQPSGNVEGRQ